jgi:hypothetical protein
MSLEITTGKAQAESFSPAVAPEISVAMRLVIILLVRNDIISVARCLTLLGVRRRQDLPTYLRDTGPGDAFPNVFKHHPGKSMLYI